MVNQSVSPRKRVLDCSPIKPTLRRRSTSELPEDRPRKRVSFAEPLIEPSKGHPDGTKVSISRRDLVDKHGNGKAVLSRVLEGSMSRTTTDNNKEKSSYAPSVKALPSKHSRGFKSQTDFNHASATGAEGNMQDLSPDLQSATGAEGNMQDFSPDLQCHKNGPVKDYIWSGTVEVVDCGTLRMSEEMLAHISKKVSQKAFAFSKKIDANLKFKLFPRSDLYPKIFVDACPDRDDIALYFYPTNSQRSKNEYAHLLKDMELKDLMMCARIADRYLLVFPSTILTPDSQKYKGCFFMWGVFCPADIDLNFLVGGNFHRNI